MTMLRLARGKCSILYAKCKSNVDKSFIALPTAVNTIQTFLRVTDATKNKLECFVTDTIFILAIYMYEWDPE